MSVLARLLALQTRFISRPSNEVRIAFHKWPWPDDARERGLALRAAEAPGSHRGLEQELRRYLQLDLTDEIALVGSGRTALRLAFSALSRLDPTRKRVICPTYCCQSVLGAILASNLTPTFIDTGPELNSLADQYLAALRRDVLCVTVVNLCGKRLDDASRYTVFNACRARGVFTIEDNAQNCQAQPAPRADMEVHSFGFGKLGMATAGGALVFRCAVEQVAQELEEFDGEPESAASDRFQYFSVRFSGSDVTEELQARYDRAAARFERSRMTKLDASLTLSSLQHAEKMIRRSVSIGHRLSQAAERFPHVYAHCGTERNIFFRFPVILRDLATFNSFWTHMSMRGIDLEGMYTPLHLRFPALHGRGDLARAEATYGRIFNVPNRVSLSDDEVTRLCDALEGFGRECST